MFGLKKSSPNNPVLVVDNIDSDFSLSKVEYDESGSHLKNIKSITTSARKTRIVSNTVDMLMTDVFYDDEAVKDPIPLFFKVKKRKIHKSNTFVNGKLAKFTDNSFIYLNDFESNTVLVEYRTQDDDIILTEYQEVYPVFIWQEQINNKEIMEIDNKKYSFKLSRGNVIVSVSKPDVYAEVKQEPVYLIKRIKEKVVKLEPFYISTLRSNDEGRLLFEYNYLTIVPDVTKRRLEQVSLLDDNVIQLENIDILKRTLVIYRRKDYDYLITEENIDDDYRDYDILLDNKDGMYDNIIHSSNGEVDATVLLRDNIIGYDDTVYISYEYIRTNNILKIETEDISLKNKLVYFSIKPTKITKQGIIIDFPPELSYLILDRDGNIALISNNELPQYKYELPLYLGYGEGVYWGDISPDPTPLPIGSLPTGYSGITNDYQTIVISADGLDGGYATGWGDSGYGEGPFGGSFLKDITDIQDLLDIKNNSEVGMISVGAIAFIAELKTANIFPYKDVAMVNSHMNRKELYNYNNILWHNSLNGKYTDIINKAPVDIIKTFATIYFEPFIQFKDETTIIVEFDTSSIENAYDTYTNIKEEYILDSSVSEVADTDVEVYSGLMPSMINKITDLKAFTYTSAHEYEEISHNIMISSDYKKATMIFNSANHEIPSNIGLGFMNSDITIYPTLTLNI